MIFTKNALGMISYYKNALDMIFSIKILLKWFLQ